MVFFVTGGSRGIGEAIVLRAIRLGHDVAFTYNKSRDRAEQVVEKARAIDPNRRCRAYQLDVRESGAVDSVAEQVLEDFDSVEVVVANAGANINNLVVSMTDEEWHTVLDTNLSGAFYVARAFLPTFLGNGFGRIVLVSSIGRGGVSGQANYAASKAGLMGLSSTLAKEYGRKGITSNVVVLGFFPTDMTMEGMSGSNMEFWLKYCPPGRTGTVEEAAGAVCFLASEEAAFINGASLPVTGGLDWAP
jgi:NAD(P)-dependent dehydrogenase (short-subunit alcohol dehydrogenase family)